MHCCSVDTQIGAAIPLQPGDCLMNGKEASFTNLSRDLDPRGFRVSTLES